MVPAGPKPQQSQSRVEAEAAQLADDRLAVVANGMSRVPIAPPASGARRAKVATLDEQREDVLAHAERDALGTA